MSSFRVTNWLIAVSSLDAGAGGVEKNGASGVMRTVSPERSAVCGSVSVIRGAFQKAGATGLAGAHPHRDLHPRDPRGGLTAHLPVAGMAVKLPRSCPCARKTGL